MFASTVRRPLQAPPASAPIDIATLEAGLACRDPRLTFSPALEHAYEGDTGGARTRRHIVCDAVGMVSFWLLTAHDAELYADVDGVPPFLRAGVGLACLLLITVLTVWRASVRPWQRETMTAVGTLLMSGYLLNIVHHVGSTTGVMQAGGMILVLLHAGIAVRLRFAHALAVNLISVCGYVAVAHGDNAEAAAVVLNHHLLFGSVLLFSTVGNFLLEFRERRGYLLTCLKARRDEVLVADAELLRELTVRDGLTGLFNRRRLDAELTRAWRAGAQQRGSVALLLVDIDDFKAFNDRYGHPAGDTCLRRVAEVLGVASARAGGVAARFGGEEFAVLLPACDADRAGEVAKAVCEAVRRLALPHAASRCAHCVTVSIGAAAATPVPDLPSSSIIAAADAALYAAKRGGRDRWCRFDAASMPLGPAPPATGDDSVMPDPDGAAAAAAVTVDRLTALLSTRLRWLRFPRDLETAFQEQDAAKRRKYLATFSTLGTAMLLAYVALCAPVLGDLAGPMLRRLGAICTVTLSIIVAIGRVPFRWWVREGLLAAVISTVGLAVVQMEAHVVTPIVYTATLALCLLAMYSSLIATQPLRFNLVPALLVCGGVAALMDPATPAQRLAWANMLGVLSFATVYSLIGGYLLELSNRRAYLLDRLRVAQLAVLRHNTEHLQHLATIDPLTRLPNRRHFETELERLAAACTKARQPLALLIVDVDHFKQYNDGYGHPAGDACLQRVGTALLQWARDGAPQPLAGSAAVPARIGGEEFGVLLPGSDAPAALAAAQHLRALLRDLRIEHAHSPLGRVVTVSVGAASLVLDNAADARRLLKAADAALYRAKGSGRDRAAA